MSVTAPEPSAQELAATLAAAVTADQSGKDAPAPPVTPPPVADPTPANPEAPAPTPEAPAPEGTTTPAGDDSLIAAADISLDGLTPEATEWLRAREREMQAVMTKRTQEAAEIRKQYEGLGDVDEVRAALGFYKGIQTDPNYAAEVYDFLTQNLTAAGYSPAQAAAKALEAMSGGDPEPSAPAPAAFGDDPDEALQQRIAQIDQKLSEFDRRQAEADRAAREAAEVNRILQQDNALRQAHPELTDEHMDYVYSLAESTQGDLLAAYSTFEKLQESAIQSYLARKELTDVPAPPPATPPAELRQVPRTLDEGMAMGLERLRNVLADGA